MNSKRMPTLTCIEKIIGILDTDLALLYHDLSAFLTCEARLYPKLNAAWYVHESTTTELPFFERLYEMVMWSQILEEYKDWI